MSISKQLGTILQISALCFTGSAGIGWADDAEHGFELGQKWCNSCHSIGDGVPRQEDAGPLWAELAKKDAVYLTEGINRRHDFMPTFPSLSDQDIADLVAYIQTVE